MEIAPQLFTAKVMHRRFFPKVNFFNYRIYYLAIAPSYQKLPSIFQRLPISDLGYRDGRSPELWARELLSNHEIAGEISHIMLITMPRVMGYVFNPVSFYLCFNADNQLKAVINEVHNTFGEQHSYLCVHSDHKTINSDEWITASKVFHVSPFLERNGSYRFKFDIQDKKIGIWIDYYDENNQKQLATALTGTLSPLTRRALFWAFWTHPLITLKAITLIHWQALKLVVNMLKNQNRLKKK
jgi:uncharacterized protein